MRQDLELGLEALHPLTVAAAELRHRLVVLHLLLLLLVLQGPLCHRHLVALPLHLLLLAPLHALPWPQAPMLPKEQSLTE